MKNSQGIKRDQCVNHKIVILFTILFMKISIISSFQTGILYTINDNRRMWRLVHRSEPFSIHTPSLLMTPFNAYPLSSSQSPSTVLLMAQGRGREDEVRRKIMKLKKEGKLKNKGNTSKMEEAEQQLDDDSNSVMSSSSSTTSSPEMEMLRRLRNDRQTSGKSTQVARKYEETIKRKFMKERTGSKYDVIVDSDDDDSVEVGDDDDEESRIRTELDDYDFDMDDDEFDGVNDEKMDEEDFLRIVSEKMNVANEQKKEEQQKQQRLMMDNFIMEDDSKNSEDGFTSASSQESESEFVTALKQATSGVGGSWSAPDEDEESYQPKIGTWGAFPRPKNISVAYGGGKRVGAGVNPDLESREREEQNDLEAKERLQRYKELAGIDCVSEKENIQEIEEALAIAKRAMARGLYGTAASSIEKVCEYCSTNSKVGGEVFLELAMAYEAVGRTEEAKTVYTELSNSRITDIKNNARKLLYGLQAIEFMRDEVKAKSFSKKKTTQEFIDVAKIQIADDYDTKRYNTAYVDLSKNMYKTLTQSVVRTAQEARNILVRAQYSGEEPRLKIVQALRFINREFSSAISMEKELKRKNDEPIKVVLMNGKPIATKKTYEETVETGSDNFRLGSAKQIRETIDGEWRLQLIVDKRDDGVKYFNSTIAWQYLDTDKTKVTSCRPNG
eukprot:CAMPEP_0194443948 /NCGR_PEP_ID=MMETSP0176-20130528/126993_1 /TAXON_ID=216777 /ORGANISM="Proboscia alata, Strain PI-D3" /LENGTH=670 /DNA_ID=CAMNT_0039270263 /DNA_START=184 /DNA_END=2196 /DNA_ORIENTATION=+